MTSKQQDDSPDALTVYQGLVDSVPGLKIKGAKSNYTSLNGNMFSFISTENQLALRLSDEERTRFLKKFPDSECYQYGALMKHYVLIPDSVLGNKRQIKSLFKKCCAHAETLKPKSTKRSPKKSTTPAKSRTTKLARKKK